MGLAQVLFLDIAFVCLYDEIWTLIYLCIFYSIPIWIQLPCLPGVFTFSTCVKIVCAA